MTSKRRAINDQPLTSWGRWPSVEPVRSPLVLIVDEDLGFVWWLSAIFSKAGCQVVPALNARDTASMTSELDLDVDVLVVNPALAGVSEMIESLSRSRSPKIVTIHEHDRQADAVYADATLERPSGLGVISQQDWLGCVRRLVKDLHPVPVACPEFS
jgi:hypothetical protein